MMTTSPIKYKSTLHALRTIVREEGVLALFKGLTPQIIGVTHVAIQFPLYEYLKKKIAERTSKTINELNTLQLVVASALSKASASVLAYPHEVLRARFQYQHNDDPNRYKGILDAVRRIYREEGYRGFYRGMGANLLRVTPAAAITFTTYESVLQRYNSWQHGKKQASSGGQDPLD
jgi:solute carrier family 25 folate transporter 32